MGPTVGANCRGIGNAELLYGFIRTVEELGKNVEGSSDGIAHTILPSFGSHDGGEILRAAIIHSRRICVQVTMRLYACPKAAGRLAYKGAKPSPTRKALTDLDHES